MQAQTDTSCVFLETELNVVQLKSIHMAVAQRQCSGDLCFLLVRWPVWREIFTFSDDNSVCDSVLASGRCENFDASRTLPQFAGNLGSEDLQSEITVVEKNSKRPGMSSAGRSGALLGSGSGKMRRQE